MMKILSNNVHEMFEGEFISNNNTLSMVNTNAESFILHISETKRADQFKVFEKVRPQNFLASD